MSTEALANVLGGVNQYLQTKDSLAQRAKTEEQNDKAHVANMLQLARHAAETGNPQLGEFAVSNANLILLKYKMPPVAFADISNAFQQNLQTQQSNELAQLRAKLGMQQEYQNADNIDALARGVMGDLTPASRLEALKAFTPQGGSIGSQFVGLINSKTPTVNVTSENPFAGFAKSTAGIPGFENISRAAGNVQIPKVSVTQTPTFTPEFNDNTTGKTALLNGYSKMILSDVFRSARPEQQQEMVRSFFSAAGVNPEAMPDVSMLPQGLTPQESADIDLTRERTNKLKADVNNMAKKLEFENKRLLADTKFKYDSLAQAKQLTLGAQNIAKARVDAMNKRLDVAAKQGADRLAFQIEQELNDLNETAFAIDSLPDKEVSPAVKNAMKSTVVSQRNALRQMQKNGGGRGAGNANASGGSKKYSRSEATKRVRKGGYRAGLQYLSGTNKLSQEQIDSARADGYSDKQIYDFYVTRK